MNFNLPRFLNRLNALKTYQKIVLAVLICGAALGLVVWFKSSAEPEIPLKEPVLVEVVKAKNGTILRRVKAVGELKAVQSVEIRPEIEGKIVAIYFTEGQSVKAGDPIFKIDDGMYKAKVKEAEARLAQAREEYTRAVKLLEKNFGTKSMRDKTLADKQVAEAAVEEAKIALSRTTIRAPFEGVLALKEVSLGALVGPSTVLTSLVDLDPINIDFQIPESYLPFVHEGDAIDVTIEDFDILPVEAKIIAISPKIDETNRTIVIRAQMSNDEFAYRPGEFAHISLIAGEIKNAVLVPEIAIEREGEEEFVWIVVDNIAIKTTVSTGFRDGTNVEITHGVKDGDIVISSGQFKVHDGEEVTIAKQS